MTNITLFILKHIQFLAYLLNQPLLEHIKSRKQNVRHTMIFIYIPLLLVVSCSNPNQFNWPSINYIIDHKFPGVKNIHIKQLKKLLSTNPNTIIVDVRQPEEFNVSHLKNSINIYKVNSFVRRFPDKNKTYIIYCSVGYRSGNMVFNLKKLGYTNAYNLRGGIFQWVNNGNPVYHNKELTNKVDPYNHNWGKLLDDKYHP